MKWADAGAIRDAHSRGRAYPPAPYADPNLPSYAPMAKSASRGTSVEDAGPVYIADPREVAFWAKWSRILPRPPEDIEERQLELAKDLLSLAYDYEKGGNTRRHTPSSLEQQKDTLVGRAVDEGYPREALASDALFWSYVKAMRGEFGNSGANGPSLRRRPSASDQRTFYVDSRYITDDLSQDEVAAMDAWKGAYLKRMAAEGTDGTYLKAYCDAWGHDMATITNVPAGVQTDEGQRYEEAARHEAGRMRQSAEQRRQRQKESLQKMIERGSKLSLRQARELSEELNDKGQTTEEEASGPPAE